MKWTSQLAAAALLIGLSAPAMAVTTHSLDLTGDLGGFSSFSFSFDGNTLVAGSLELSGFTPFTLESGDTIAYTINFIGQMGPDFPTDRFVIPAASAGPFGQLFAINFSDFDDSEALGASNSAPAPVELFDPSGDIEGLSLTGNCGNCLSPILGRAPGPFAAFSFTGLAGATVVTLAEPYFVERITFGYQVQEAFEPGIVPEPESWAMLIAGFGLIGASLRRRRAALA